MHLFLFIFEFQTYAVQDCWRYNPLTSNDNLFSCTARSSGSASDKCNVSYSSTGLQLNSISSTDVVYLLNSVPTGDYSVEFEIVALGTNDNTQGYTGCLVCNGVQYMMNTIQGQQVRRFDESAQSWVTPKVQTGDLIRFNVESSTVKVYHNETLKGSKTSYNTQTGLYSPVTGRTITVKNLKIKPL